MHKKKSKQSVLAGEMILTFCKTGVPQRSKRTAGFDVSEAVGRILAAHDSDKVFGEFLFNKIVIEAWKSSAIGSLHLSKTDFIKLIEEHGWAYDEEHHYWVRQHATAASFLGGLYQRKLF